MIWIPNTLEEIYVDVLIYECNKCKIIYPELIKNVITFN